MIVSATAMIFFLEARNMNYIKEFVISPNGVRTGSVRTDTYANSVGHISRLAAVIQTDFPTVDLDSMTICHYAGGRIRRTYGVEFRIPNNAVVPDDYVPILEFECLF